MARAVGPGETVVPARIGTRQPTAVSLQAATA